MGQLQSESVYAYRTHLKAQSATSDVTYDQLTSCNTTIGQFALVVDPVA